MTRDPLGSAKDTQFRDFIGVLKRRKVLVISMIVLFGALGAISIPLTAPNYRTLSRILVEAATTANAGQASDPVDRVTLPNVTPDIGQHLGYLQSPEILNAAFAQAQVPIPTGEDLTTDVVTAKQEGTTSVIDMTVNLPSTDASSRVAQAIPVVYNDFLIKARESGATTQINSLQSKLSAAQEQLRASENALAKFRDASGEAVASASEGEELQSRLHQFETQLELARTTLAGNQSRYDEALKAKAAIPKEITNPNLTNAIDRYSSQQRKVEDLRTQLKQLQVVYADKAPEVRAVQAQLLNEQAFLQRLPRVEQRSQTVLNPEMPVFVQRLAEARAALSGSQAEVAKLEPLVAKERVALEDYKKRVPQEEELQRAITLNQNRVLALSQNLEAVKTLGRPTRDPVQVLGISSAIKTSPAITRTGIISLLLGIIMGIAAALIRDRADNRVHTLDQIFDATGAMPLGQVSVSDKALALGTGRARNAVLEGYRTLRFNLESSNEAGPVQSVLVVSASAGEGRAGLSHNLAMEAATDERRTILVDGDMRTPELHDRLKAARSPGLSDVLAGRATLDEALVETSTPNLMFLPSGTEIVNPLELLASTALDDVHQALKDRGEVIVLNSPSLLRYSDGRAYARIADSVLYVAKRGFTKRDAMRYCVETLRRAHARLLGVVLSDESVRVAETPFFAAD